MSAKLFKMVQKMQMYDACSKNHPLVPQDTQVPMEFQDYVLHSLTYNVDFLFWPH